MSTPTPRPTARVELPVVYSTETPTFTLETKKYVRKPFHIDAVQITDANMADVASWCSGDVKMDPSSNKLFIKVQVNRPLNDRQTQGFVGDWVLYAGQGFKVYTARAFERSFEEANAEVTVQTVAVKTA